ncbi:hypothetical protein BU26DRAFT_523020 [Trematosphaeria pertusa]|uniref:Uncharacterized protein n=1 Tax=Trematosphaeria pertusa TaxID=390896 RepID=A0A6A6I2Y9_9PLEO|nr:uncharacterized protein BU26DRAFT_523020 [Trematosphaeria pertusa]KAF2244358.1 hypothetical protein BU26DRAFT_523020 [Trematosphaeria pertusa]
MFIAQEAEKPLTLKTPAHATGVFKSLETPDTVRRRLNKPLNVGMPSRHLSGLGREVESPYADSDDEQDPYFRGQPRESHGFSRRQSMASASPSMPSHVKPVSGAESRRESMSAISPHPGPVSEVEHDEELEEKLEDSEDMGVAGMFEME